MRAYVQRPQSPVASVSGRSPADTPRKVSEQGEVGTADFRQALERASRLGHDFSRLPSLRPNRTGLPEGLKAGIESLSGMSLDHVRVHYHSPRPAQLNALAYAQGRDIHVAPGQERHLPHEAWHVVQQAQGRVQPTIQRKSGVPINDDRGLEHEADVMGAKALAVRPDSGARELAAPVRSLGAISPQVAQLNGDKEDKPQGWGGGLGSLFRRHVYGPHSYDVRHTVATDTTPERQKEVIEDVQHRPTTGWRARQPVSRGGTFRFAAPVGIVKSKATDEGVQNETTPFHLLHSKPLVPGSDSGIVKRTVERDDEGIHIRTRGTGTGILPSLNEKLAHPLWGISANLTRFKTDPEFRQQHHENTLKNLQKWGEEGY